GSDTLQFNGSDADEVVDLSANGSRLRFVRDVGKITMDVNGTERVNFNALGGADKITVNDLSGTDVTEVNLNLAAANGAGDNAADTVIVKGTTHRDTVVVAGDANDISVVGLAAQVHITGSEPLDQLNLKTRAGRDVVDASGLAAGAIQLSVD